MRHSAPKNNTRLADAHPFGNQVQRRQLARIVDQQPGCLAKILQVRQDPVHDPQGDNAFWLELLQKLRLTPAQQTALDRLQAAVVPQLQEVGARRGCCVDSLGIICAKHSWFTVCAFLLHVQIYRERRYLASLLRDLASGGVQSQVSAAQTYLKVRWSFEYSDAKLWCRTISPIVAKLQSWRRAHTLQLQICATDARAHMQAGGLSRA